jgi:hypothetical protein
MSFPPGLRWWGFDCGHLKDITPRDAAQSMSAGALYRDLAYVRAQCESLAQQIDAAALLAEAGYGGPRHLRGDAWSAPGWAVEVARRFQMPRAERLERLRRAGFDPISGFDTANKYIHSLVLEVIALREVVEAAQARKTARADIETAARSGADEANVDAAVRYDQSCKRLDALLDAYRASKPERTHHVTTPC